MNREFEEYVQSKHASVYYKDIKGYGFLNEGEAWVCFENPNESEDLLVRTSDESLLLFFDQWAQSFPNDAQGIADLIAQMENIMEDRAYIWKARIGNHDFVSLVNDEPGVFYEMARGGFEGKVNGLFLAIAPGEIEQTFIFWDPLMMQPEKTLYMN